MEGMIEIGKCDMCKLENVQLWRKYYYYDIKCECHSNTHFEIVTYCKDCIPQEPRETKITLKTENLSKKQENN